MTEIERVPFHGKHIHTAHEGEPVVILKPTLEEMGLDFEAQRQKLSRKSWATTFVTQVVASDGRTRDMVSVNLDTWAMLLANIDEHRVSEAARPLVVAYQKDSARALRQFWTEGAALNEDELIRNPVAMARLKARLAGVESRRDFTAFLKEVYDASSTTGSFQQWAATFTETITKTALRIDRDEFRQLKSKGDGNARNAMSAEQLTALDNAETMLVGTFRYRGIEGIKAVYEGTKELLS